MSPKVSFITVNYNQPLVTCELLNSLKKLSFKDFEVIIVDNASAEDHSEDFKSVFPDVKIIMSDKNLGFAGGNNLGIRQASGEFLFFVNNDTEVTEGLLEPLIARLTSDDTIGAVCPKIRYFHHPELIQFAGYTPLSSLTCRNNAIGDKETDQGQYEMSKDTPYAHGAAMMVKKEAIEKAGEMPEVFFLYYEELDWSERIKDAGYRIVYEPAAIIYHKESISTGKDSPFKTYYLTRNRILFCKRNFKKKNLIFFLLFFTAVSIPKNTLSYLIKGQFAHLSAFFKGILWNFNFVSNNTP